MSATGKPGPGRPAIPDPDTLAKGRLYCELVGFGLTANEIAVRKGVAKSEVHRAMTLVRSHALVEPSRAGASDSQPEPRPRRLSRRAAQSRAWEYAQRYPILSLASVSGIAVNHFWIRLVEAIHEEGDGFRLRLGEPGSRFPTRGDLAFLMAGQIFDMREIDVSGWLDVLIARGRLIDIDKVDIGIPLGLGLVPGENARGQPVTTRAARRTIPDQRQPFMPQVLDGGRSEQPTSPDSESGNIPPLESGNIRISPDSESGDIPQSESGNIRILPDSDRLACTAAAAAKDKDICNLAAAAATESRARESGNIRISPDSESGNIPAFESGNIPSGEVSASLSRLVAELVGMAGIGRAANAKDLGAVQGWAELGDTPDQMRDALKIKRGQMNGEAVVSLAYFNGVMADARKKRKTGASAAPAPPSPPAAALCAADQAIHDLLKPCSDRWRADIKTSPFPPHLESFKAAIAAGTSALAYRWLDDEAAWARHGSKPALKPPDFSQVARSPAACEERLLEIEEGLTAPDTS
jgi:hypothetical protein